MSNGEIIRQLLTGMVEAQASDLHLVPGYAPTYRTHGRLRTVADRPLDPADAAEMVHAILPDAMRAQLEQTKNVDFSLTLEHHGISTRFRANAFYSKGNICGCFRHIPNDIPSFEWMGFPAGLAQRIVAMHNGLVIVSGVTGSGKTTTLAALIKRRIEQGDCRVITVEEPIEYIFQGTPSAVVTQREVGTDVDSFYDGLTNGLRQDPDVMLIGEIRDPATARMALSAAETGHLILATMHTQDAKGAVTRFVDLFPHDAQDDVRSQLSLSLRSVICQHLLPNATEGEKRALALEILNVTHPVRAAIRFGKVESIESAIQTGRRDGMLMLDESLAQLAAVGKITWDTARRFAKDPDSVKDYAG